MSARAASGLPLLLALLALLAPLAPLGGAVARADATDVCIEANAAVQRLRKEQRLIAAGDQAAVCARDACPALVRKECVAWARELQAATPMLTVQAVDAAGAPVTDARLLVDGKPVAGKLDGAPVKIDPGPHTVRVERDGEPPRTQSIEAHADVRLVFELGPEKKPEPAKLPSPNASSGGAAGPSSSAPLPKPATPEPTATPEPRPVPTSVYVLGAVGAVGLTTFAVTGTLGKLRYDKLRDECPRCTESDRDAAKTMLRVADLSLVIGALASGLATYGYLTRPVLTVQPLTQGAAAFFTGVF